MQIKRLNLQSHNFDAQINFYARILEFPLSEDGDSFTVSTRLTSITFSRASEAKPFYHFAFNIPQNKFNEAMNWASERVELIKYKGKTEIDFSNWNAHSFYFLDPGGNIIEFIARHSLENNVENKFDAGELISISEIGIPVHDVKKSFELVESAFNIPLFDGNQKTFTAAGDDNGLFIIVPIGRKWFPDYIPAEISPMEIVIEGKARSELDFSKTEEGLPYKIISEALPGGATSI